MNRDIISTLKKLGLTTYESLAYITLNSLISATAQEVSDKSRIPRSKVYDVLNSLVKKQYVEVERGRPLIFHVIAPTEVLKREKEKLTIEIDDSTIKLNEIYENEISQVQAPIWRVYGVEKIINKELEIIRRSKKSINMRIGFLFEGEGEKLLNELKNKPSNVEIKILASSFCYLNDKKVEIVKTLQDNNISVCEANVPFVKMIISDSKEMIHTYTKFSGDKKSVLPNSAIGIWNKYEDIANNYDERFIHQFKKTQSKN